MNTFANHPGERGDAPGWPVIVICICQFYDVLRSFAHRLSPIDPLNDQKPTSSGPFRFCYGICEDQAEDFPTPGSAPHQTT